MKNLRFLLALMGLTLAAIAGFQVYWLKENYAREKRNLNFALQSSFGETIRDLQVKKLSLTELKTGNDSGQKQTLRVFMQDNEASAEIRQPGKNEIVSTINVIRDKLMDSLRKALPANNEVVIRMGKDPRRVFFDSMKIRHAFHPGLPGRRDEFINILYGVDSLQDSIRVKELDSAFTLALDRNKINIPFSITRVDSAFARQDLRSDEFSVGIAHPVTFRYNMGNSVPYLLKRISLPILFSVLLLGITLLSFMLLYRNLVKQKKLAELKNEFISNITHELKTPIATVGVAIEALKNFNAMNDPARTREYLDISANELQRLSLLVDKVLKLSMFEKKEMDMRFEQVDLAGIVQEVVASMRLQAEKQKALIHVQVQGETILRGDRLHLLSVVYNLLDNALKYAKESPQIDISLTGTDDEVTMKVKDNGIGIPPEYQGKVFDKFFRVPHGDTHNAKGYGLGLSYAAQVIHKHGGTISVESTPGSGTSFTFVLPKQNT
jgi:two-component system phosphate regulon sensor histidine kinase PhoR